MKGYLYIIILVLAVACQPHNGINQPTGVQLDSIYTTADFRAHDDFYNSGHQVYAIDLLSNGLEYDSAWHITGSGCNLFLSDIFVTPNHSDSLPAGVYQMDSTANDMTFLRGMDFEGNVTGTYLLLIAEDQIQRIILFTSGSMTISYQEDDVLLDFQLYDKDSTYYHATYMGPAIYR